MASNSVIKSFEGLREALNVRDYDYVIIGERQGQKGSRFTPKRMRVNTFIKEVISGGVGGHTQGGIVVVADIAERDGLELADGLTALVLDASADLSKAIWGMYTYVEDTTSWVLIASEDDVTYQSALSDGIAVPTTIGGIDAGTTAGDLRGLSPSQMWDALLFPTIQPSSSAPFVVLTGVTGGNFEVGTNIAPNLVATFNQGSITNGDSSPGPALVGPGNNYSYTDPDGSPIGTNPTAGNSDSLAAPNYVIEPGNNIWNVVTNYDAGTGAYFDSKGIPSTILDPLRVAGSVNDNSANMSGRYYAWRGFGAGGSAPTTSAGVRGLASKSFLSTSNTGSFNIVIPPGTQEVYFFVPAGKTATVLFVESSNADVTGTFTVTGISVDDANGDAVAYESFVSFIGVGGYPATATYAVTIS
jgi:hypothetical protein